MEAMRASSLLVACCALLALVIWVRFRASPQQPPPTVVPPPRTTAPTMATTLAGHWLLGKLERTPPDQMVPEAMPPQYGLAPAYYSDARHAAGGPNLHVLNVGVELFVVPRAPRYVTLVRPHALPAAPNASLHIEPPLPGNPPEAGTTCLTMREKSHQLHRHRVWTVEAVVNFLENQRFGRQWQTIFGVSGHNMSRSASRAEYDRFSTLAVKLSPERKFLLQLWLEGAPVTEDDGFKAQQRLAIISKTSEHVAEPNKWYHVSLVATGAGMSLHINGHEEIRVEFEGSLPAPKRASDGDLTFGCGMFDGHLADTCSCLLTEARVSDSALQSDQLLWIPKAKAGA